MIACFAHAGEATAVCAGGCFITGKKIRPAIKRRWPALGLLLCSAGMVPAALTISPPAISSSFKGTVNLTITNLTHAGQRVIVEKFYDRDHNAAVNAGDPLMQRFLITDGQVTSVAGRRNVNVPGDEDGSANGSIETKLHFAAGEIPARLDGRFILRVSPDGAGFPPFTGTLTVTQQDYGGSGLSGRVMAGATPQAGALVLITSGAEDDFDVAGMTRTDASGNYSLTLPPGYYRPVPVQPGYVCNLGSSSAFTVQAGSMTAAGDALLTAGTRTISGQVRDDAAVPATLGGMLVFSFGESGVFTFTFTDASGNYTLDALAGPSEIGVLETQSAALGVLPSGTHEETGTGHITGLHLSLPRPTALIYGTVRTAAGSPVPWLDVYGEHETLDDVECYSITDAAGNYTLGIIPGAWSVDSASPGYLSSHSFVNVAGPGLAALLDLTVNPVTAHLRGTVRDNNNQAVPHVEILAHDFSGASSWSFTDANGNFDLGVHGGPGGTAKTWAVQLNQNSGDAPATHISSQMQFSVTDGTDINGITYRAYVITAHLRGTVLDENNAPVGDVNIFATQPAGDALTGSNVAGDGTFDIPVFGGAWSLGLSFPLPAGFMAQNNLSVTVTSGSDVNGLIFRLRRTTGAISGSVKNTGGAGLAGLTVVASATIAGIQFSAFTNTDGGGNYSLTVCPGLWTVSVDGTALLNLGYQPVPGQQVNFTSGNATINFTASTGGGLTTFSAWQTASFTAAELNNPGISGPNADPDGDKIPNFLEYALHLLPKTSDAAGLPFPGTLGGTPGGGPYLTLTFRRRIGAPGLAYNVLEAPDLDGPWTNVTSSYEVLSSDGTVETVRARTVISAAPKFMRLQVQQQP